MQKFQLYHPLQLTPSELLEVQELVAKPVFGKYMQVLASSLMIEYAESGVKLDVNPELLVRHQIAIQAKLEVLTEMAEGHSVAASELSTPN